MGEFSPSGSEQVPDAFFPKKEKWKKKGLIAGYNCSKFIVFYASYNVIKLLAIIKNTTSIFSA